MKKGSEPLLTTSRHDLRMERESVCVRVCVCVCDRKERERERGSVQEWWALLSWMEVVAGNTNWKGRLSTVDLLTKVACFVEKVIMFALEKGAELNELVRQLYPSPLERFPWLWWCLGFRCILTGNTNWRESSVQLTSSQSWLVLSKRK